jgi:hypothetical protein
MPDNFSDRVNAGLTAFSDGATEAAMMRANKRKFARGD